jgi:hypothetical protein
LRLLSTFLLALIGSACLAGLEFFGDDEKAFGSRQCRLMILVSAGGLAGVTTGAAGSIGCKTG